jgi:hypothetical protein
MLTSRFKRISIVLATLLASVPAINSAHADDNDDGGVSIKVFAPGKGDVAGIGSRAFLVDLAVQFPGNLASTGVTPELTGPDPLQNAGPFPGTFSFGANKDHFPGLVVLLTSTTSGAGRNLANLFNINTITNQSADGTEVWSTWIVGAAGAFGKVNENTPSRLFVAVVDGTAPDEVTDVNGDGVFDKKDLKLMGYKVLSNTPKVDFVVNGF